MINPEKKPVGKTKDVGYQIGVRKTLPVDSKEAWEFITSREGVRLWMDEITAPNLSEGMTYELPDGTRGEVRVMSDAHLRMSWHPPDWPRASTIQVRVIPKGEKSVIAFHQEHLPGPEEREQRREFYKQVVARLAEIFAS